MQTVQECRVAIETVDAFFDGVFAPLESWLPELTRNVVEQLRTGKMTGSQLASFVEADAHRILDSTDRPLYGAGYCASELVVSEGNPLAWWQGPERGLLASSTFGPGQAAIDLVRLEWYRVPQATGERHIAGPFVDYLCSNEITLTSSIPVLHEGEFLGVICADVLVASLETELLPQLNGLENATLLNASGRVVVSNNPDYETGDRFPEFGSSQAAAQVGERGGLVRSSRYPFLLLANT